MYTMYTRSGRGDEERVLDPVDMELGMVVNCHLDNRELNQSPLQLSL